MDEFIITFRRTLDAIMGERKLLDAGIPVQVMPMPGALGPACGMALRLDAADIEKARALLHGAVGGIYRRSSGNGFAPWNA